MVNNVDGHNILISFFETHSIYFIPVVNLDGFHEINLYWKKNNVLEYIRKNMRVSQSGSLKGGNSNPCTSNEDIGVDLNRNYDFAFGRDEVGSNGN